MPMTPSTRGRRIVIIIISIAIATATAISRCILHKLSTLTQTLYLLHKLYKTQSIPIDNDTARTLACISSMAARPTMLKQLLKTFMQGAEQGASRFMHALSCSACESCATPLRFLFVPIFSFRPGQRSTREGVSAETGLFLQKLS